MEPQYLIFIAGALACPLIMGGAMWLMMRQMNSPQTPMNTSKPQTNAQRSAALLADREALDKEIRELEAIQTLEERRRQLESANKPQTEQVAS